MCRIDYDEGDGGRWLTEPHARTARKEHRCDDCGRTIGSGERYTYGAWAGGEMGGLQAVKMCGHCHAAGRWLREVCGGHFWPGVVEELEEHWGEEPELRSVGLGRLILLARHRGFNRETMGVDHREWRRRDGELVQIAEVNRWVDEALARVPAEAKS